MSSGIDSRQVMIVLQNALGHATQIAIHNAKDKEVDVEDVIKLAKVIASEVVKVGQKLEAK